MLVKIPNSEPVQQNALNCRMFVVKEQLQFDFFYSTERWCQCHCLPCKDMGLNYNADEMYQTVYPTTYWECKVVC